MVIARDLQSDKVWELGIRWKRRARTPGPNNISRGFRESSGKTNVMNADGGKLSGNESTRISRCVSQTLSSFPGLKYELVNVESRKGQSSKIHV
jgi:hypothetical protein